MDVPCPKPKVARLTSPEQQAEMRVVLCGRWPPLKPLPVFKCEADEYRASIEFDKLRGEWVCRKTSLTSNKVQEMRGGLADIAIELPEALDGHQALDKKISQLDEQAVLRSAQNHSAEVFADAVAHKLRLLPHDQFALGIGGAALVFA